MAFLNSIIGGLGGDEASGAISGLLKGYDEDMFQKGVVDPAMRQYENQVLPSLQQRFTDANAGSSSALNQALSQSAQDLSSSLAGKRIDLQNSMAQQQLGGLGTLNNLIGQRTFDPIVQGPQGGMLKDILSALGSLGAGYMASSINYKTNIRDYKKGLEEVRKLDVKQYDYTIPVEGSQNDRVGLIAEKVPNEIVAEVDGIKAVDLYGLVSILVNCVKQLDAKVKVLEGN